MKHNKKIILILLLITVGILIYGWDFNSRSNSYKGNFFNSSLSEIKFYEEWNKLKGELKVLKSDEKYLLKDRALKLVIVPAVKAGEDAYRGNIEVEVVSLIM
ncbi:hypothetical protein [Oceanirhabdus sp. W0125-5]|uniref:hypothetical protein n=1 Tax=Oceanirhabdus sp. W0125-5 TaxID=2999116 RepID=UPI0022F339D4|nr:hypothetical protein [Oceanirhabdus sp. W0125-5]WBW98993.1 hypothetical protein OW730_09665 [Oceanirhabdus sp. W0125-5]